MARFKDIDSYISSLEKRVKEIEKGKPLEIAVRTVIADMSIRIYQRGKGSNGTQIGSYSTTETFIGQNAGPNKKPFRGKLEFQPFNKAQRSKTGKPGYFGKTFKGGYAQFKKELGLLSQGNQVNLRLFNDLQSDWANASIVKGNRVVNPGKPLRVNKNTFVITLKRRNNQVKRKALEGKYGRIFDTTKGEQKIVREIYSFEAARILGNA